MDCFVLKPGKLKGFVFPCRRKFCFVAVVVVVVDVVCLFVCFLLFFFFDVLTDIGFAPWTPTMHSIEGGRQIKEKVL